MFLEKQSNTQINHYLEYLEVIGSFSNLFSDNSQPYLDYRVTENLFCMCLDAKNLSRSDCTADASKDTIGFGIKTFLNTKNNHSLQKIAEFNKLRNQYANLSDIDLIYAVAHLRNDRIQITKRMHNLDTMLYHCTIRDPGKIYVAEYPLDEINLDSIKIQPKKRNNTIAFQDNQNEYSFNISKSTLYKRFYTEHILYTIPVQMIANPYETLKSSLIQGLNSLTFNPIAEENPHIFLRLYTYKSGEKFVPERSGLNQWNAQGRSRNADEIYIPIYAEDRKYNPDFFPNRDVPFSLILPNGTQISAKICQEGGKALMSNPNSHLGHWLLRHVLQLAEGELVTYNLLKKAGFDSVVVYRIDDSTYSIDFTALDSYESFMSSELEE